MPQFVISYYGGKKFENAEEGKANRQKWNAWIEGLGDAVINKGTPLGATKTVSGEGVSDRRDADRLNGFSIVSAADMDQAVAMARACPFLEVGTIEVAEVMNM